MSDTRLLVPALGDEPWPTLGYDVCDFIEAKLCHGPGDILGEPVRLIDEVRGFILSAYEVYPEGHEFDGRRRFKRAVYSRRKGVGKTEVAAWLAIVEMDPEGPVRCDGWRTVNGERVPVGRPVHDPYIPMVATTEGQTEDLAYSAVYEILSRCELGEDYEIGLERIMHKTAPGKIQALASAPSARDGARTTFQHFDETHLFVQSRLIQSHKTMLRNIPKRYASDAWSLETTTMYAPGEDSVAETAHKFALDVHRGLISDSRLLYDHRQASEAHDLHTKGGLRAAIEEASGDALPYTDVQSIEANFHDPATHENEWRRYWGNQPRRTSERWFKPGVFEECADLDRGLPDDGAKVVLAFDGSYNRDSTVLIGCTVEDPFVFVVEVWERPTDQPMWRTPRVDVDEAVAAAMERWTVLELAPDPPGWHREIEDWEATYGDTVVRFETNQPSRMGPACDEFYQAGADGEFAYDGSEVLERHIGNAVPKRRGRHTVITKEATDSPNKIDAAVGAVIAYHRAMWHANQVTVDVNVEFL